MNEDRDKALRDRLYMVEKTIQYHTDIIRRLWSERKALREQLEYPQCEFAFSLNGEEK